MLTVAIDVQHLYRSGIHARDQGTIYTLPNGTHISEAHCATIYAGSAASFLRRQGAHVLTNNPQIGLLCGPYSRRNSQANAKGAGLAQVDAYLACHVNAGGGDYARLESMSPVRFTARMLEESIGSELISSTPEIPRYTVTDLAHGDRGAVCIEGFNGPGIIVEPFFGDNPKMQPLMSADRLVGLGEAIARGVWHLLWNLV
jgi:N-acetylmuramoyl-L-alanine amidase